MRTALAHTRKGGEERGGEEGRGVGQKFTCYMQILCGLCRFGHVIYVMIFGHVAYVAFFVQGK